VAAIYIQFKLNILNSENTNAILKFYPE